MVLHPVIASVCKLWLKCWTILTEVEVQQQDGQVNISLLQLFLGASKPQYCSPNGVTVAL